MPNGFKTATIVVLATVVLVVAVSVGSILQAQTSGHLAGSINRLHAADVNASNMQEFEVQLRRDLPIGTPRAVVERYLRELGVDFAFVDQRYGPQFGNTLASHVDVGQRNIAGVMLLESLRILIHLDDASKVRNIETSLEVMGP